MQILVNALGKRLQSLIYTSIDLVVNTLICPSLICKTGVVNLFLQLICPSLIWFTGVTKFKGSLLVDKVNVSFVLAVTNIFLCVIGSIVSDRQFQFDSPPPQAGAIYAGGWSITPDGNLALGDQDIFYQCLSGSFYNLYDRWIAEQCSAIRLQITNLVIC